MASVHQTKQMFERGQEIYKGNAYTCISNLKELSSKMNECPHVVAILVAILVSFHGTKPILELAREIDESNLDEIRKILGFVCLV